MIRPLRLLASLGICVALATAPSAAAIAASPRPTAIEDQIEDQDDRPTLNLLAEEAQRSRPAVERFRSGERNFVPDPDIIGDLAAPPQARPVPGDRPVPAIPRPGVGVVASLLLGLVGGVAGGGAVLAGWTAATRRRPRQPASAT